MSQGLQCFDATGKLILDVSDRLTRVLGEFNTGTQNGSITDDNFKDGFPWIFSLSPSGDELFITAEFSISDNTISWVFTDQSNAPRRNKLILYGVY